MTNQKWVTGKIRKVLPWFTECTYGGKHCTINWTFIILVNYWQCQIVADFCNVISKVEFKTSHLHLLRVV